MLNWSLANSFGILRDQHTQVWNAGHVNDVLELTPSSVLVASDGGGVWQLEGALGLPLSLDWPSGDTKALAQIGPGWVMAGGSGADGDGFLYVTDPNAPLPLWTWLPVAVPAGFGAVTTIVVVGAHVVVATVPSWQSGLSGGLWTARIPDPTAPSSFAWGYAAGLSATARVTGLAEGPAGTVVVGADSALAYGQWRADVLTVSPADAVNGAAQGSLWHVVLASCPSDRNVVYASSVDTSVNALMRSDSGGRSWDRVAATDMSTGAVLVDHSTGGYCGTIAVSPFDPNVVVLGDTLGPWISVDGANTFFGSVRLSHDDKHRYRFTSSGRLYEACDGGVFYTDDLSHLRAGAAQSGLRQMHSGLNRSLANLQFLGPTGVRDWWGRANASRAIPGLIGGGLQDNNDVYCLRWPGGSVSPWQCVPAGWGFDGQSIFFLADDSIVVNYGSNLSARWSASPSQIVADASGIQVRSGKPGITYANGVLPTGAMSAVAQPSYHNAAGELLYAVSSAGMYAPPAGSRPGTPGPPYSADIYGLFVDGAGTKHWDFLANLPVARGVVVSAIATFSGHKIFVGVRGDQQIWNIDCDGGYVVSPAMGLGSDPGPSHYVADIVLRQDTPTVEGYAVYNSETVGAGRAAAALFSTVDGVRWAQVVTSGLPLEVLYCILYVRQGAGGTLFVATDTSVYMSNDAGATWVSQSAGLPTRPHSSDLFMVELPDGRRRIYLATFGWSVWVSELAADPHFKQQPILYHYPYRYPDDAPRPVTKYPRLTELTRPRLGTVEIKQPSGHKGEPGPPGKTKAD